MCKRLYSYTECAKHCIHIHNVQKIVFIYMIETREYTEWGIHIWSKACTKCGLYKLVDSYTFRRILQNWLIHINSEAITICTICKNCHGYEIGNPNILRAHFSMFVRRSWTSACANHFSIPCQKCVNIRTHPLLIRVPCNPHVSPYLKYEIMSHFRVALQKPCKIKTRVSTHAELLYNKKYEEVIYLPLEWHASPQSTSFTSKCLDFAIIFDKQ